MNMHQTTTADFAPCKDNYNAEPKLFDVEKSVQYLHLDAVSALTVYMPKPSPFLSPSKSF